MASDGGGNGRRVSRRPRHVLRDVGDPARFVSFGPWESPEQVDAWRASTPFQKGVARIRELLDGFEPGTYELSAEVAADR